MSITCTHTCTNFWESLGFVVYVWQYWSDNKMFARSLQTTKSLLFCIKKAPLSSSDNRAKTMGGIGLEPTTSCVSSRRSSQLS